MGPNLLQCQGFKDGRLSGHQNPERLLTPVRISSTEESVLWRMSVGRGVARIGALLCCLCLGCGEDLELGTSKKDGALQIGKGGQSLQVGAQSGGGRSGSRRIEDIMVRGNVFNLRPATFRPLAAFVFVDLRDPDTFQEFADAIVTQR